MQMHSIDPINWNTFMKWRGDKNEGIFAAEKEILANKTKNNFKQHMIRTACWNFTRPWHLVHENSFSSLFMARFLSL
jgi:hypothetical protein